MTTCLACFCESGFTGRNLQLLVDELFPSFECETKRCSPFSPAEVGSDEQLAFLLIDPLHYDPERKKVVPSAFQELTKRDLSTLRITHSSIAEVEDTVAKLTRRGASANASLDRTIQEVCIAKVADIRAQKLNEKRCFAVYDTALEQTPSHASIFCRTEILNSRQARKKARSLIHQVMSNTVVSIDELNLMIDTA